MFKSPTLHTYYGPNIWSPEPALVADWTLNGLNSATAQVAIDRMVESSKDWFEYKAQHNIEGEAHRLVDFVVQWAQAALTYRSGVPGASGYKPISPNRFTLWIGFYDPRLAASALTLTFSACASAMAGELDGKRLRKHLEVLWDATNAVHPGMSTRVMIEGAKAIDVPFLPAWSVPRFWQFGWGAKGVATYSTASNRDGVVSNYIISKKRESKMMIEYLGFPVPADVAVNREDEIPAAVERIGFPCVVKPSDQGQGRGVSAGLMNIDEVRSAFKLARKATHQQVMIERHLAGSDHRIMMVDGKVAGVFRRDPSVLTGDGSKTVRQLIDDLNRHRVPKARNEPSKLCVIELDDVVCEHLRRQGVLPETVLPRARAVTLRSNGNVSTGGTSTDVTGLIHPDTLMAAEMIAQTLDVRMFGLDFVTTDISKSWRDGHGAFIEMNLTPGLDVPTRAGWSQADTGRMVLGSVPGRIPVNCVIVADSDAERLERACREQLGSGGTGWASHRMAQVGSLPLRVTAREPWSAIEALLGNRTVERALAIVPTGHLMKHGLPVDKVSQAWICDRNLPNDWRRVVYSASNSGVETRDLDQLIDAVPTPLPVPNHPLPVEKADCSS